MRFARRPPFSRLASPLGLSAIALLVAFWQRPHEMYVDTRIELLTDPWLFLERVAQLWTSTIDLGHIQASQFVGYLFPMGSFFALGHALGIPMWIVQRFWIGGLLAIAAWGTVRLVERLLEPRARLAGFVAGLLYLASPFVVVSLNRGTGWLLPYAMLPWLLLWTHRGIGAPGSWRAPALIALLLLVPGGGLNAPLMAWVLLAMAMLAIYEAMTGAGWRATLRFTWRAALCTFVTSLWWLIPVLAQVRYGADYLTFTEHPEAILQTPSASESLRLLGYWVSYTNAYPAITPEVPAMGSYLLSPLTILATFTVPLVAIVALTGLRGRRYVAFFGLLLAVAVLLMSFGFPPTNFLGRAVTDAYYNVGPLIFMRTTYKAAPLAALAMACLCGLGVAVARERLRHMRISLGARRVPRRLPIVVGALILLVVVAGWGRPLWGGHAGEPRLFVDRVPAAWTAAIENAQTTTPPGTRIAVLPGELFAEYRWGDTQNSIVPALSRRPVLIRQITRPAPTNAAQLLDSTDNALQQGRLMPGQLPTLLQLMGVGRVLVGTDQQPEANLALDPARVATTLAQQPGFARPVATFGAEQVFQPPRDRDGPPVTLPEVRAYAAPVPPRPGIIRAHPASAPTIVDGDAEGVVSMAAVGALDPQRALFYSGDLDRARAGRLVGEGARLVFTDSNRRRPVLTSLLRANIGATLGPEDPLPRVFPDYDPFPALGSAGRTVARYTGLRALWSPLRNAFTILPEHRPYAAFDGNLATSWIPQENARDGQFIQLVLSRPRPVRSLLVHPHRDPSAKTTGLGLRINGGPERVYALHRGWNRLPVHAAMVRTMRIRAIGQRNSFALGSLDEVRIPGLPIREALQLPTDLAALTAGRDLSHNPMSVVMERATADFPRHVGKPTRASSLQDPVDMSDAEPDIRRLVTLPGTRRFSATGWAAVRPAASDAALDRLVGLRSPVTFTSSSRFEGLPRYRASSAFDASPVTAWLAEYDADHPPWVQWDGPRAIAVREVRLAPVPGRHLQPTRVVVRTPQGGFALPVRANGIVRLPVTVRTTSLRISVTAVHQIPKRWRAEPPRTVGFSEVRVPGLAPVRPRRTGTFAGRCGDVHVTTPGQILALRVRGTVPALDGGNPLAIESCTAGTLRLHVGVNPVTARPGPTFSADYVRLDGAAPRPTATTGRIASADADGNVRLVGPGWLVLGQGYSPGWRAWCRDATGAEHELGAPQEIDGFANGWRIDGAQCQHARFAFAPQSAADIAYWISAAGVLVLLALLVVGALRGRRRRNVVPEHDPVPEQASSPEETTLLDLEVGGRPLVNIRGVAGAPPERGSAPDRVRRVRWAAALPIALIAALVAAVVAGGIPAVLTGAGVLVLLRVGVSAGRLYALAAVGVVVVIVLYLTNPAPTALGINFNFPIDRLNAHWFALAAVGCLLAGGLLQLADRVRERRAAGPPRSPIAAEE